MVDADRGKRKGGRMGGKKRRGPRHWPHRAEGSARAPRGLYSVIAH